MKRLMSVFLALGLALSTALALPVPELDYQGKILIGDVPFTGDGYFKFAIGNAVGTTNFWTSDGSTSIPPAAFVTNACYNGVFSTVLGAPPLRPINPGIFNINTTLFLRVWFSTDGATFGEMLPFQRIASSAHAVNSDRLDGWHALEIVAAATNSVVLGGDVSGGPTLGTTVGALQGHAIATGLPATGNVLTWDGSAWTNAPGGMSGGAASNAFVLKAGDTMYGTLTINAPLGLRINSDSNDIAIGTAAGAARGGTAVGGSASADDWGVAVGVGASGGDYGVAAGHDSTALHSGVGLGSDASGSSTGTAVGAQAAGDNLGVAVGYQADGSTLGVAVGHLAVGRAQGAAVGHHAGATTYGAAVGPWADGTWYGAALGRSTTATNFGVAVGFQASGSSYNMALGVDATARGTERVAIGHQATNVADNSTLVRGTLYLDGATGVWYRSAFGSGPWKDLLAGMLTVESDPVWSGDRLTGFTLGGDLDLGGQRVTNGAFAGDGIGLTNLYLSLDDVIWVATNGTPAGPGTVDMPFDTPQAGYNAALPGGAVVIAAGVYSGAAGNLNMARADVHVIGLGRPQLNMLQYASAPMIAGTIQIRNLAFSGPAQISGAGLKCVNCRFTQQCVVSTPANQVEFQNCFFMAAAMTALWLQPDITGISVNNCSIKCGGGASALQVETNVQYLSVLQCEIESKAVDVGAVADREVNLITPQHLYSHNVILGDPAFQASGSGTVAFFNNTVQGDLRPLGINEFHANNVIVSGTVFWGNADPGMAVDAANGNVRLPNSRIPGPWMD